MIDIETMDVRGTALPQLLKRAHLRSHERKDSLLFITQIHHRYGDTVIIGLCQQIDDGQLERIKVLYLIHLYPRISMYHQFLLSVGKGIISKDKQIFKVEQQIFLLILFIMAGKRHLPQRTHDDLLHAIVIRIRPYDV